MMQYQKIGQTDITVSRIILGCGCFGGIGSAPSLFDQGENEEQAHQILDAAVRLGITTFDTADAYGGGRSETYIGSWLQQCDEKVRSTIVLSSKTYNPMFIGDSKGLSKERISERIDGTLKRLGIKQLDMYLSHEMDEETPLKDTLTSFNQLQINGKIRAYGASNINCEQLEKSISISDNLNLNRYQWIQNSMSLLNYSEPEKILEICSKYGLGFTPYSPLAGGWLTGKYQQGQDYEHGSRMTLRPEPYENYVTHQNRIFDGLNSMRKISKERFGNISIAGLSLAWLLADHRITGIIVGPRKPEHLEPIYEALNTRLNQTDRVDLANLFPVL
jgi:aryl-alcohol dehydrogenase-like predicted oxidoreductase